MPRSYQLINHTGLAGVQLSRNVMFDDLQNIRGGKKVNPLVYVAVAPLSGAIAFLCFAHDLISFDCFSMAAGKPIAPLQ